ncbi:Choline-sulfatase [Aquisphaera giovannonii]|uniref:Choline-sulfatase n=1 Tax=Aquisphaera giovannonii TaxID=406548 RepID=A0A5B9W9N9_9BACT|nr:alkaline phosphatase [Aquisphaera giovannonii]QEH37157.1 Choline-sulfatase [Aquisphaera giovannonii]
MSRLAWIATVVGLMVMPVRGGEEAVVPRAGHVVIIGVDGLSPDGLLKAKVPVVDRLKREGAWSFHARGVMPTVSSPNWASMIMGAGPEQHGVLSNEWQPGKSSITPTAQAHGGFPTVFGILREQRPKSKIGIFHDWDGFARLVEPGVADVVLNPKGPQATVEKAVEYIMKEKPTLTFIHLDHVDHAGHHDGHGTPQYYAAVAEADRLIGEVLRALERAGMAGDTLVLITADHGGKGKGHGGNTMGELEIPWIVAGPGVARGKEIGSPVNTFDTAATVAAVLGINPPECWIARPVRAAFAASTPTAAAR